MVGAAAQTQTLTITGAALDGSVAQASGTFAVQPNTVKTLSFTGQPIDTQVYKSTAPSFIYSMCAPATSTPCASTTASPASSPVAVKAVDLYGNAVLAQGIVISVGVDTPVTQTTSNGTATYADLLKNSTTTTGSGTVLRATASLDAAVKKDSNNFRVLDSLKGCPQAASGVPTTNCIIKSLGKSSKTFVNAWSKISTTNNCGFFCTNTNVLQSTQLTVTDKSSKCGGTTGFGSNVTWIGDIVDQRVTGTNTQVTTSGLELIVIPKDTLKNSGVTSRNVGAFNICFGAIWIGGGTPSGTQIWKGKTSATNNTLVFAKQVTDLTVVPQLERYYGIPADCSPSLPADYPCIFLRTKQKSDIQAALGADAASIMTDADLGIIIRVGGSWDGGSHAF